MPTTNDRLKVHTKATVLFACAVAGLLLALYGIWFGLINEIPAARDSAAAWGAFGDFFGGILNPLVAGLALFWLTRSIEIQKEELASTKFELSLAKIAQQDQAKTLEKQRFENTFFSLLEQHNAALSLLNSINQNNSRNISDADFVYNIVFNDRFHLPETRLRLQSQNHRCGHYFRILYQLLKFIAMRCPSSTFAAPFSGTQLIAAAPSEDEKMYSNIIRAFLGTDITQLLAVNCACEEQSTYWTYKCLIERYSLLEHMPFKTQAGDPLRALSETRSVFRADAFGNSDYLVDEYEVHSN